MDVRDKLENENSTNISRRKLPSFLFCCVFGRRCNITRQQVKIYIALFLSMFGSAYSITMLFPFLPFMVQFLLPEIDPTSIGKYAGMIASAMFLGRFIGSYTWGALADALGHKPVLIISSILLGIASMLFGLSVNFPMAIAMRLLVGLVNGVVGNAKASMSENSTNENQAFGMSILAASYGVGIVMGPAISGAVADPIGQYHLNVTNSAIRNLLTKYPYSLPCFVNTLVCFGSAIAVLILLPQTKIEKRVSSSSSHSAAPSIQSESASNDSQNESNTVIPTEEEEQEEEKLSGAKELQQLPNGQGGSRSHSTIEVKVERGVKDNVETHEEPPRPKRKTSFVLSVVRGRRNSATLQYVKIPRSLLLKQNGKVEAEIEEEEEDQISEGDLEDKEDEEQLLSESHKVKAKMCSKAWWSRKGRNIKGSALRSLRNLKIFFKDPVTRLALISYSVYSFVIIGFDEIYSLWCATPVYLGGLSFTLSEIGTSLCVVGAILLPFSLCLFPFLERRFGTIRTFMMNTTVLIFCLVLLPNLHFLVPLKQPVALWVGLCALMVVIRVVIVAGFGCTSLIVNNSTTFDKLGSINGLALMMTSGFRFVSPLFAGSVYSVSLSATNQSLGFPLDYHLIFVIFGLILLIVMIMTSFLPLSINNQKIIPEDQHSGDVHV